MNLFSIETLAIGDELLTGKIADTNSAFVGQVLFENGFRLSRQNVIPDEKKSIQSSIQEISKRAKVAVCFGGSAQPLTTLQLSVLPSCWECL